MKIEIILVVLVLIFFLNLVFKFLGTLYLKIKQKSKNDNMITEYGNFAVIVLWGIFIQKKLYQEKYHKLIKIINTLSIVNLAIFLMIVLIVLITGKSSFTISF